MPAGIREDSIVQGVAEHMIGLPFLHECSQSVLPASLRTHTRSGKGFMLWQHKTGLGAAEAARDALRSKICVLRVCGKRVGEGGDLQMTLFKRSSGCLAASTACCNAAASANIAQQATTRHAWQCCA